MHLHRFMAVMAAVLSCCLACTEPSFSEDAGATADDAGRPDGGCDGGTCPAPSSCTGGVPCCPEDLNFTGGQSPVTLKYPRALVRPPPDADGGPRFERVDGGPSSFEVRGTWGGTRQLALPYQADCVARFRGAPPCTADTVVRIAPADGGPAAELLVGMTAAELSALAVGTEVEALITPSSHGPQESPIAELWVRSAADGAPLLIIAVKQGPPPTPAEAADAGWTYGPISVRRDEAPVCVNSLNTFCNRLFVSEALRVSAGDAHARLTPGEEARFATDAGSYRVTHRAIVRRIPSTVAECADFGPPDLYSFELLRVED